MSEEGRWSKVSRRVWNDEKFRNLTPPPPNGQTLYFRLLFGVELTCIPGLFQASMEGLAKSLGWSKGFGKGFLEGTEEAFREVIEEGLAEHDPESGLWFLKNAINHNEPTSPNVIRGWKTAWIELPECELKKKAAKNIAEYCSEKGESWAKAFAEAFGKPNRKPSGKPSAKTSHHPSPNQEQEQEQEKIPSGSHLGTASVPPPKPNSKPKRWRRVPSKWEPNEKHQQLAAELGVSIAAELPKFRDHEFQAPKSDPDATFRTWLRNAQKFAPKRPAGPGPGTSDFDPFERARMLREAENAEKTQGETT